MPIGDTDTSAKVQPPRTIREAIVNAPAKIVLAFFLTVVAAVMVIILLVILVYAKGSIDAGTIALIASMVMLFIKMAADGNGYQFNSSAGSDKKDDVNATVSKALADKVQPPAPVPAAPTPDQLGASMLSNGELTYFKTLTDDEAKKAFLAMSSAERQATIAKV